MKLDEQEKRAVIGAIKAMFEATPPAENSTRLFYVDTLQRIEADFINRDTAKFINQLADKILERTEKVLAGQSVITEEVSVRASVVKEMYARIKEKVNNEQSK